MINLFTKLFFLTFLLFSCEQIEPSNPVGTSASGWDGLSGKLKIKDDARCEDLYGGTQDAYIEIDGEEILVSINSADELATYLYESNRDIEVIEERGCYSTYHINFRANEVLEYRRVGALVPSNPERNFNVLDITEFNFIYSM